MMVQLELRDLKTYYFTNEGVVKAVDRVNIELLKGDTLGLAGESGCGKSTVGMSLMKLVPYPGKIVDGEILLDKENIANKSESEMRTIRWKRISMIFQGAMNSLNPLLKIGDQIAEPILLHSKCQKTEAREKVRRLLDLVGIDEHRIENYPFEFSGGMKQRAMIAMALACDPEIVIADEPTTALDVITQAQVLRAIKELQRRLRISIILISHDLSVIAEVCNRLAVMYAGKIVEYGDILPIFDFPMHPYSRALIASFPSIKAPRVRREALGGDPPDLVNPPLGCRFHTRCQYARDVCRREEPEMIEIRKNHYAACHLLTK